MQVKPMSRATSAAAAKLSAMRAVSCASDEKVMRRPPRLKYASVAFDDDVENLVEDLLEIGVPDTAVGIRSAALDIAYVPHRVETIRRAHAVVHGGKVLAVRLVARLALVKRGIVAVVTRNHVHRVDDVLDGRIVEKRRRGLFGKGHIADLYADGDVNVLFVLLFERRQRAGVLRRIGNAHEILRVLGIEVIGDRYVSKAQCDRAPYGLFGRRFGIGRKIGVQMTVSHRLIHS